MSHLRNLLSLMALALPAAGCGEQAPEKTLPDAAATAPGDALLSDGVVGRTCETSDDVCGPFGRCARELTGGAAFSRYVDPLPAPLGYCSAECSKHEECGSDGVCFGRGLLSTGGECRRACARDQDCEADQECAHLNVSRHNDLPLLPSTCQPKPETDQLPAGQAGRACDERTPCEAGFCAEATHAQGGFCSGRCTEDAHCGEGGVCVRGAYGSAGICRERCEVSSDCQNRAAGWGCAQGICERRPPPLPDGVVGKACGPESEANDCGPGTCRTFGFSGERYPGGYCVARCREDADCGAEGVCINRLTCLRKCAGPDDCRPEYECRKHPQAAPEYEHTVCYPKTSDSDDDDD